MGLLLETSGKQQALKLYFGEKNVLKVSIYLKHYLKLQEINCYRNDWCKVKQYLIMVTLFWLIPFRFNC